MHLVQALPDSVSLSHDDYEWVQTLEYEHVPFRCRKFHTHGHLFRDCPINPPPCKPSDFSSTPDAEGFTKVQNRRRHNKESPPPNPKPPSQPPLPPSTSNNFEILDTPISDTPLSEAIPKAPLSSTPESSSGHPCDMEVDNIGDNENQITPMEDENEMVDIRDLEIFTLEQAWKKKGL